jgi:hypothetical protein
MVFRSCIRISNVVDGMNVKLVIPSYLSRAAQLCKRLLRLVIPDCVISNTNILTLA